MRERLEKLVCNWRDLHCTAKRYSLELAGDNMERDEVFGAESRLYTIVADELQAVLDAEPEPEPEPDVVPGFIRVTSRGGRGVAQSTLWAVRCIGAFCADLDGPGSYVNIEGCGVHATETPAQIAAAIRAAGGGA